MDDKSIDSTFEVKTGTTRMELVRIQPVPNQRLFTVGGAVPDDQWLMPRETAKLLRIDTKTLGRWRMKGYGPKYQVLNPTQNAKGRRYRYLRSLVIAWMRERPGNENSDVVLDWPRHNTTRSLE
jgi:hypothetical protein